MDSSLILYPRSYNLRGGEHLHSVMGVTEDGREVTVKLRLEESLLNRRGAPSIKEFARDDRKARQACISDPNNGPGNREGVLLFTRVSEDAAHRGTFPAYIARQAFVLAEDSDSPDPIFGYGRLAIEEDTPERRRLQREREQSIRRGEDISALDQALSDGTKFHYPAIVYHPEESSEHDGGDTEGIRAAIESAIESRSRMGVTGGVMVRARDPLGRISSRNTPERFARFIVSQRKNESGRQVADQFIENELSALLSSGQQIDVMPLSRINSGPRGNQYYGSNDKLKVSRRLYEREPGQPAICRVAIRLSVFEDTQNTLLSRIYAMSGPLGAPAQLDRHGVHLAFAGPGETCGSEGLAQRCRLVPLADLGRYWKPAERHQAHQTLMPEAGQTRSPSAQALETGREAQQDTGGDEKALPETPLSPEPPLPEDRDLGARSGNEGQALEDGDGPSPEAIYLEEDPQVDQEATTERAEIEPEAVESDGAEESLPGDRVGETDEASKKQAPSFGVAAWLSRRSSRGPL